MEKKERGSKIIFPIILRLEGISSGGEEKRTDILGKKIKNRRGEEYQVIGNFIHPGELMLIPQRVR